MKQKIVDSKKKSFYETLIEVVMGFLISLPINFVVLPLFADTIVNQEIFGMMAISLIFTSISLVRKFTIRRWFENMKIQSRFV